ncbi:MAG TPA: zinc-binding dehydrogenase, partial [Thermoanaerobaculia bacterium]|nr:zinc-binding dehydrogenase [Thermoanaerobaculia bacterium]
EPVIGLAGSGAKCRFVEERLGAHACFETAGDQLGTRIRSLTAGRGIDLVLDSVGGSVLDLALELLAPLGRLVSVGFSSIDRDYRGALPTLHLLELFHRSISVSGLNLENLDYPRRQSAWRELVSFVECHGLRPVVGEIFPLHHVAAAHQALESRATFGKLILRPGVRPAAGARAPFELTAQPPE